MFELLNNIIGDVKEELRELEFDIVVLPMHPLLSYNLPSFPSCDSH